MEKVINLNVLQSQISIKCGKGVWLHYTGKATSSFHLALALLVLWGITQCLSSTFLSWRREEVVCHSNNSGDCYSGTGDIRVNFGDYWCFKAKGVWCVNEMLSQESKVCYKLINQDSFVIIFSNALVSSAGFAYLCLCMHLGEKKILEK